MPRDRDRRRPGRSDPRDQVPMIRLEPLAPVEPGGDAGGPGGEDEEPVARPERRRRVVWAVALVAALALAVAAAAALLLVWGERELARAAERFREVVGPLDAEAYRPAPVPDAENAALPVLEVLERMGADVDPATRRDLRRLRVELRRPASAWSDEEWRLAHALAHSPDGPTRSALEPLRGIADRADSDFGLDYSEGPEMEMPNLLHALGTADLLHARARLAWRDGRPADGAAAVEALSALSRALEGEALFLFQIVGHEIETTQYRAIQDALAPGGAGRLDRRTLARLRASAGERARTENLRRSLGAEASMLYDLRPEGRPARSAPGERSGLARLRYRWLSARLVAGGLEHYVRVAETALPVRPRGAEGVADPPEPASAGRTGVPWPDVRPMLRTFRATESLRRLARLAVDLSAEGAARGVLPETLPEAPAPDPLTGRAPLYRRASDGSATLSLPGAEELRREAKPGRLRAEDEAPLYTWTLSAPETVPGGDG